jgi:hypothetical protein
MVFLSIELKCKDSTRAVVLIHKTPTVPHGRHSIRRFAPFREKTFLRGFELARSEKCMARMIFPMAGKSRKKNLHRNAIAGVNRVLGYSPLGISL